MKSKEPSRSKVTWTKLTTENNRSTGIFSFANLEHKCITNFLGPEGTFVKLELDRELRLQLFRTTTLSHALSDRHPIVLKTSAWNNFLFKSVCLWFVPPLLFYSLHLEKSLNYRREEISMLISMRFIRYVSTYISLIRFYLAPVQQRVDVLVDS